MKQLHKFKHLILKIEYFEAQLSQFTYQVNYC